MSDEVVVVVVAAAARRYKLMHRNQGRKQITHLLFREEPYRHL
jgi:hypothetical protein